MKKPLPVFGPMNLVFSYFFLFFSQAEAEEKKKTEAKARSKRESEIAPSYAVSRL